MTDAERVQDPRQRSPPRAIDGAHQVLGALARESVQALEGLDREPIQVGWLREETPLDQLVDDRIARALDVHPTTPGEVEKCTHALRRAPWIRAAPDDLAFLSHRGRPAGWTGGRHLPDDLAAVSGVEHRGDDLGDHVAGPLQ